MKVIPLTQSKVALVDDRDYDFLSAFKWVAQKEEKTWYAAKRVWIGNKWTLALMHRMILGFPKIEVDHRDGNGLNNQRDNLRIATKGQNQHNRRLGKNNKSGFKGVYPRHGKWFSQISCNNVQRHLGSFDRAEDAAKAYDAEAIKLFGEFARTNFTHK